MKTSNKRILFIYSRIGGYAGQQAATDLLVEHLTSLGYRVQLAVTWAFDRDKWGRWAYPFLLCQYLFTWCKAIAIGLRTSVVCLNLGQTRVAFLREGTPFRILAWLRPTARRIVSLHGSVFMGWQIGDPLVDRFLAILKHAHVVTVLGPQQRQHLIDLGVPADRVEILCNTTDVPTISAEQLNEKFETIAANNPVHVLFLSNLIISKGYLIYLKALLQLAKRDSLPKISAVLCGPLRLSEFSDNHTSTGAAREEIEQLMQDVRDSDRIAIEWIEGARGETKLELYRQAHLFVFPSQYPVEAQPLVLLEAMASGCAIVTSKVGEIPFTMGDVGLLVDPVTVESVAAAIADLVIDREKLTDQAKAGQQHFADRFALSAHLERWMQLLNGDDQ